MAMMRTDSCKSGHRSRGGKMLGKKTLTVGFALVLIALVSVSSYAAVRDGSQADPVARFAHFNSGTSDAKERVGFLDLRSAHVRVGAETVTVHLATYAKWRPGWLLQCRDSFFAVGWLDDQVQVDIDKREGQPLRAFIRKTDSPHHVVGRVRAHHPHPRTVTFTFATAKLQSREGKWFAASASPGDKTCKYQYYGDKIPDDGGIVP
jgi:hypothetical protein